MEEPPLQWRNCYSLNIRTSYSECIIFLEKRQVSKVSLNKVYFWFEKQCNSAINRQKVHDPFQQVRFTEYGVKMIKRTGIRRGRWIGITICTPPIYNRKGPDLQRETDPISLEIIHIVVFL